MSERMNSPRETNPPLDGLKGRSFPEVAAALRMRSARIMERWQQSVLEALPAAEELTLKQLRDHIPYIVDQLIESLQLEQPEPMEQLSEMARPHGEERFHEDYNVNELMIEYHLLRRI